jgi:hypothetical protein
MLARICGHPLTESLSPVPKKALPLLSLHVAIRLESIRERRGVVNRSDVERWVEGYVRAWNSNDPQDIEALFTTGASYRTEPYADPWEGRDAIVRGWIDNKDEPGQTEFTYEVLAIQEDLGLVKGWTVYKDPPRRYANLWEIRLDDDVRCTEFVEWWMRQEP